jgi:putative ABC transport system ATP-binding protein
MALIQLRQASKCYEMAGEEFYAAKAVDLEIEKGEFVAIMGPSGSGKTTIMHLMGLLDNPTSGGVWIDNMDTSELHEEELAALRNEKIGFVFQSFHLLARTSALDNIALPLWYAKQKYPDIQRQAAWALESVGLDPTHNGQNHPSQLSGGQQQRVAIARAIVNEPDLILADEPTGNLDSKATNEILALFQELNEEGKTIVIVTHEEEIGQHAKRIIRFRDGNINADERVPNRITSLEGDSR